MEVRSLNFSINHKINDSKLIKANKSVDKYKQNVEKTAKNTKQWGTNTTKTSGTLRKLGGVVATAVSFTAIAQGISIVQRRTAEYEEQTSKFNTVFGKLSDTARNWTESYADSVGRSVVETQHFLAESQNMLVGFGATRTEGFELSKQFQTLAVDLASFNNLADEDALTRLQSGLLGNHEAVKSLGIVLNENILKEKASQLGYKKSFKDLDALSKIQVRYAVAVDQSQDSIGDAERTSGSYTNQLKKLKGRFFDLTSTGGGLVEALKRLVKIVDDNLDSIVKFVETGINVASKAIEVFASAIEFSIDNMDILLPLLSGALTIYAGFKIMNVINKAIAAYNTLLGIQAAAQTAVNVETGVFNTLMAANPVGIVIIAVGALIALIVALVRHWDTVTEAVSNFTDKIGGFFGKIGEFFEKLRPPQWITNLFGGGNKEIKIEHSVNSRTSRANRARGVSEANTSRRALGTRGVSEANTYARGSMYTPGGLSVINETPGARGEVLDLPGGTRVYTEMQSNTLRNNRSGQSSIGSPNINMSFNVNIDGAGKNSNEIMQELKSNFSKHAHAEIEKYFSNMATAMGMELRPT